MYLGSGDEIQNQEDGTKTTLKELLGGTPLNYVELEVTKKSGVDSAFVRAFTVTFCTSERVTGKCLICMSPDQHCFYYKFIRWFTEK